MQESTDFLRSSVLEPLLSAWDRLRDLPWVQAMLLVVGAYLAAKFCQMVLARVIGRLTAKTKTDLDDRIISLGHGPVFVTVFFFGLALALGLVGLPEKAALTSVRLLRTIVVFYWLTFGFRVSRLVLASASRNRKQLKIVEERTIPLFDNLAKVLLVASASYMILLIWKIDPTAWLTSAGILGIAVGFAAKDTLANLFGGVFIVADAPYKLGDFIVLDSGERGRVTHVGLRSTRLLTRDDVEITIPNAVIANSKITNESGGPSEKERIRIKVGVAYGSDLDQVCEVLEAVAVENEHVCLEPEPRVRFRSFGDSSLDFELLCWIDEPVLRGKLIHLLNLAVYKAFQREKIEIPFPQQDVHIRHMPPQETS